MKTTKNSPQLAVVYIITKLELGGAQKVCLSLLDGLEQQHHQAFLISGTEGPLVEEAQKKENVILLKNFIREVSLFAFIKEIKTFFSLIKELRKLKKKYPNLIVHTHSTKAGLIGRWAAFFAGAKRKIHTIHGYGFNKQQPKIVWLTIYLLELVSSLITTNFVCVSQKDANTGKKLFPRFSKKHTLIHAAIEWEKFYQPARIIKETFQPTRKEKTIVFGTISCFKKQKNLFDLLAAFNQTYKKHPNCRLEMIGDGTLRPNIEEWITNHNLNHAITLHGWQSNIVPIAQKWHALVMTSLWEGLPCTVIEARLLKLPVISYETGGIPEVIIHEKNGLIYKQKDWKGIAQGMITLIENHETYRQLKNYSDNLEMFKNQTMVEKHVNLYKNLR